MTLLSASLLATSLLCALLFLHPYILYPLSLRLFARRPVVPDASAPLPTATLFFCAYNEEQALPAKLANLEAIKALHPDLVIRAYSDLSSDRTAEILSARPDLLTLLSATERTGKATGMARMVALADTDVCIFTDANVMLEPSSIARLLDCFRDPQVGGVSGKLHYVNDDAGATASVGGLYWRLEERIKALESRCGSMMGADGSIFATRRSLYPHVPPHLLDDMIASTSVLFHGLRLISGNGVIAYEKSTTSSADEFRRKRRIACRAFNTHRYLWPQIRATFPAADIYKYVSHKLLRWFGAPLLTVATLGLTVVLAENGLGKLATLGWAGLGFVLMLGHAGVGPFTALSEILRSILATFIGIIDSWRGRTYQTWAPAQSRN